MTDKIKITEEKIRPRKMYDEFFRLAQIDSLTFFKSAKHHRITCPACLSSESEFVFRKNEFSYEVCPQCETLFVNPRADSELFDRYYREGQSIEFLCQLYKKTEDARKELVNQPQIELVSNAISKHCDIRPEMALIDIGAGYGTFCMEFAQNFKGPLKVCAIEPSPHMAKACKEKGILVINKHFESVVRSDLFGKSNIIFTCFELVGHLADPERFFRVAGEILEQDELLIFTANNGLGFDILLLWENSESVYPPHHLNFFNPGSITTLLNRHGFRVLEIATPGRLDVDIVRNSLEQLHESRFWKTFMRQLGQKGRNSFQKILRDNQMSSYMVVIAQKQG